MLVSHDQRLGIIDRIVMSHDDRRCRFPYVLANFFETANDTLEIAERVNRQHVRSPV